MRVVFIDIDGVLNSTNSICANSMLYKALGNEFIKRSSNSTKDTKELWNIFNSISYSITDDGFGQHFDHNCIRNLETLKVIYPDLKFVISSSWRYAGLDSMKCMFNNRSKIISKDDIIDITYCMSHKSVDEMFEIIKLVCKEYKDDFNGIARGHEIEAWIRWWNVHNPNDLVDDYLILDDDSDMLKHQMSHFIHTNTKYGFVYENLKDAIEYFKQK